MNLKAAQDILNDTEKKLRKLRDLKPYLLDVTLRENSVGSGGGQTLLERLDLFSEIRKFGFENIILGTLNYSIPDELQVEDDFMIYLRDHSFDVTGCFALTSPGRVDESGLFVADVSMQKLKAYKVPNTILEVSLSQESVKDAGGLETVSEDIKQSIAWLHENIRPADAKKSRLIVNIVDGCDAFAGNLSAVVSVLELLAGQDIEGVSFQDSRGTFLPFQVGAFAAIARSILPKHLKLLVHIHAGSGFENASVIEALLNGADGIWGGLTKNGPVIGHASTGELMINLMRLGNVEISKDFQLKELLPLVRQIQKINSKDEGRDDFFTLGKEAFRLPLNYFAQKAGRFMDLQPDSIGGKYDYRICAMISDSTVLAARLVELTGQPEATFPAGLLDQMIRLMRQDLRAGQKINYDEPENLMRLCLRASLKSA